MKRNAGKADSGIAVPNNATSLYVKMTFRKVHIILLLFLLPLSIFAKKQAPALSEIERQRFIYYFYEAERLYEKGDYEAAFQLIDFCYLLNPEDAIINQYMGDFFSGFHKPHIALPFYEKSYANDPLNEGILARLEHTYVLTGQTKKAIRIRDKLDRRDGYDAYSAMRRYQIYAAANDAKKSLNAVEDYLKLDPNNIQFLLLRLQVLEVTNAPAKKLQAAYEQVLTLNPDNIVVLNNYAYFLATHKGDLSRAEQMSRYTLQAEPRNPTYLDTYAWILYLRGELLLAQMYIRQAIHMYDEQNIPEDVLNHYQIIMKE